MAHIAAIDSKSGIRARLDNFFAGIGQGFNTYVESRSRVHQIHRLNELSDAELKKLGLTRDGIAAYVFRDLLYI
ncbi:hypothetical protein [Pseudooceanicola sp.]|uniref:hypothetical protein n=1 Tax=Pseudooceanicola sp. TaxID=1914328 RepID=UPI00261D9AF4|nr:hypothetical protein [Pseudooceanicola sp.]MDF1854803.1 hypothetical protein [Pseudooceanicola sp.]